MEALATNRTLGISELLELILLGLPLRDLYQAQRVCKGWKAAISSSFPIQHAMWLAPANPSSVPAKYEGTEAPAYHLWQLSLVPDEAPSVIKYLDASHQNPLFQDRSLPANPLPSGPMWEVDTGSNEGDGDIIRVVSRKKIRLHVPTTDSGASDANFKATWEHMQIASPPCKVVETASFHYEVPLVLRDETGVRLGQLVRAVASLERRDFWADTTRWVFCG
ncbi:hypothetical protein BU16DRAFT_556216 [Lophium mytilinum]|uniref:F-box domain-containing protein n=1 Tax=Lophium mytilinum TaxID=390894 RepID=A0A6A6RDD5_9PEZI|nr:hypothetical protein BU16DRAFT_556216 [Lophium mytilinum]